MDCFEADTIQRAKALYLELIFFMWRTFKMMENFPNFHDVMSEQHSDKQGYFLTPTKVLHHIKNPYTPLLQKCLENRKRQSYNDSQV